jgi:hypothetical protein
MYNTLHHTLTYERLPEDEPSVLKHVEEIKKLKIFNLEKVHFVGLYCIIILQYTVQKHKIHFYNIYGFVIFFSQIIDQYRPSPFYHNHIQCVKKCSRYRPGCGPQGG